LHTPVDTGKHGKSNSLFVSHAPADDAFAQALTQALIEAGVDAHAETFGPDQQTPRDEHDIILRDCAIFLPVLSRAALSSPRARSEARHFYDTYHDEFGRFILPVLVEPLELDDLWPFLHEYQRIEGPPDDEWSSDALIAGVLQWVTLVIPARARSPSGTLRQTGGPVLFQGYARQTGAPARGAGMGLQTRPLGEALIAIPPERALQTIQRGRSALTITLLVALILAVVGGLSLTVLLLRGQAPPPAAIAKPIATASAAATETETSTATVAPSPTATTARAVIPPTATPLPAVLATFVGVDTTTGGTWSAGYGSQGYLLAPNDGNHPYSKIPGYALVNVNEAATYIWMESTTDQRATQKPGGSDRIAACWYSGGAYTVDIGVTDGQTHRMAFYFLDWDSYGSPHGRVERVDAQDATTGATLNSRSLGQPSGDANPNDQFNGGKYLVWDLRGHVRFTITNLNSNAVLSGIFFA
jgi:TIR domain